MHSVQRAGAFFFTQKHITILQQVQTQHIRIMRCNMLLYLKYSVKNALSFSNGMMSI